MPTLAKMSKKSNPTTVEATLTLPGSKSYTHRALMAAALAAGESILTNALSGRRHRTHRPGPGQLGAGIDWQGTTIRVTGHRRPLAAGD